MRINLQSLYLGIGRGSLPEAALLRECIKINDRPMISGESYVEGLNIAVIRPTAGVSFISYKFNFLYHETLEDFLSKFERIKDGDILAMVVLGKGTCAYDPKEYKSIDAYVSLLRSLGSTEITRSNVFCPLIYCCEVSKSASGVISGKELAQQIGRPGDGKSIKGVAEYKSSSEIEAEEKARLQREERIAAQRAAEERERVAREQRLAAERARQEAERKAQSEELAHLEQTRTTQAKVLHDSITTFNGVLKSVTAASSLACLIAPDRLASIKSNLSAIEHSMK